VLRYWLARGIEWVAEVDCSSAFPSSFAVLTVASFFARNDGSALCRGRKRAVDADVEQSAPCPSRLRELFHAHDLSYDIHFEASEASHIVPQRRQPRALCPSIRLRTHKERERQGRPG
jgi:hypothetical protein